MLGQTFIESEAKPRTLTVLTSITKGQEDLQNAFHTWTFSKDIVSTNIINNDLYILFSDGDLVHMLLEIPGDFTAVDYNDEYTEGKEAVISGIEFSQFFVRDREGKGTKRGRYQLRTLLYSVEEGSRYYTDIISTNNSLFNADTMFGDTWDEGTGCDVSNPSLCNSWDDTLIWVDIDPGYVRQYTDDEKITLMADSSKVRINFYSSIEDTTKGFILSTANIEGFFNQRSSRI